MRARTAKGAVALIGGILVLATSGCQSGGDEPRRDATVAETYREVPRSATENCIQVSRIDRLDPLGDHTLLFYTRGNDVWRNRLSQRCPGMRSDTVFLYEPEGSRLCKHDIVYQLHDVGFGFQRGAGCGLGEFDRITEDQAAALKQYR